MCYSLRSSIMAFTIAITTSYFMYKRGSKVDKYLFPFIFIYAFMQLAEALMWYDQECGTINKIGTNFAYFNLILHVLAIGTGIYLVEKKLYGIILGILILLYYLIHKPEIKCSVYKKNTMYWGFSSDFYIYIFICCLLLAILCKLKTKYKIIIITWYSLSWLYFVHKQSHIIKYIKSHMNQKNIFDSNLSSSLWCHLCSFTAPLLYFINQI